MMEISRPIYSRACFFFCIKKTNNGIKFILKI
jgi:hypothetical protein